MGQSYTISRGTAIQLTARTRYRVAKKDLNISMIGGGSCSLIELNL